jgi:hypothetical protein
VGEGNGNLVYASPWDFKSSFICHKILRHGTFRLYFPSDREVYCGFLSPWPGSNPQILDPVASTLTTTPPRRHRLWKHLDGFPKEATGALFAMAVFPLGQPHTLGEKHIQLFYCMLLFL